MWLTLGKRCVGLRRAVLWAGALRVDHSVLDGVFGAGLERTILTAWGRR